MKRVIFSAFATSLVFSSAVLAQDHSPSVTGGTPQDTALTAPVQATQGTHSDADILDGSTQPNQPAPSTPHYPSLPQQSRPEDSVFREKAFPGRPLPPTPRYPRRPPQPSNPEDSVFRERAFPGRPLPPKPPYPIRPTQQSNPKSSVFRERAFPGR